MLEELVGETVATLDRVPVRFRCRCSHERVLGALVAVGRKGLEELIDADGSAEVTCEFCAARYRVGRDELACLLAER
jgi:molecular chaperone Hsp33